MHRSNLVWKCYGKLKLVNEPYSLGVYFIPVK